MDIKDLRFFVVLAEERHFGRTAGRLYASKAQVSQRIQKLEQAVGGVLIQRDTRNMQLTQLGSELLNGAVPLLETHQNLVRRIQERASGRVGTIRMALNVSATYSVLPTLLRILYEEEPGVHVRIVNAHHFTPFLEKALLESRVDMIITRAPLRNEELESLELFRETMAVLVPSGHRLAKRDSLSPADLEGESLVSFPLQSGSAIAVWVDQALRREGVHMHRRAEAEETTALLGLVAAGLGIAIVPNSVSILHPQLRRVPLSGMPVTQMVLGWHRATQDELVQSVVSVIRNTRSLFTDLGSSYRH